MRESIETGTVHAVAGEDESRTNVGVAFDEATGQGDESGEKRSPKKDVSGQDVVVLGSGNLGLIYLMEEPRRLTVEEIEERHPRLIPALRSHPRIGFVLAHSAVDGPMVLGPNGVRYLADDRVAGDDPLGPYSDTAAVHRRTDGFAHAPGLLVNSFYDAALDEAAPSS